MCSRPPAAIFIESASETSDDDRLPTFSDLLRSDPNEVVEFLVRPGATGSAKEKGKAKEKEAVVLLKQVSSPWFP